MLSKHTKLRLLRALGRKSLLEEFESKLATPGPLSSKLKNAILYMMGHKRAAEELIQLLETSGVQQLSGPHHPNAKRRLELALLSKKAAQEVIDSQS